MGCLKRMVLMLLDRLPLAVLGQLVALEEGRGDEACKCAGVHPLKHFLAAA